MLIVNWGNKSKKLADMGMHKCGNCGNMEIFELREVFKTAGVYFIPVAKWNKKKFLVCQSCSAGFEVADENTDELIKESMSLPDNDTTFKIWERIQQLGLFYKSEIEKSGGKFDPVKSIDYIRGILLQDGHQEHDIDYVMSKFIESVVEDES